MTLLLMNVHFNWCPSTGVNASGEDHIVSSLKEGYRLVLRYTCLADGTLIHGG